MDNLSGEKSMKTWYDEEERALLKEFNELCEKSALRGTPTFLKSRRAGATTATINHGLWHSIVLASSSYQKEPTVKDYMKALKRAMDKKEKPVYNSALKEALNKPSWR